MPSCGEWCPTASTSVQMVSCDICDAWYHTECVGYGPQCCLMYELHSAQCPSHELWECACSWVCEACGTEEFEFSASPTLLPSPRNMCDTTVKFELSSSPSFTTSLCDSPPWTDSSAGVFELPFEIPFESSLSSILHSIRTDKK